MHNDVAYWHARWRDGRAAFHEAEVNPALVRHGHLLGEGGRVLVPLCGKSRDLTWLAERGHAVVGVEVAERPIHDYFEERRLVPTRTTEGGLPRWDGGGVTIHEADFFAVSPAFVGEVTAAYDRAALIAMPPEAHAAYAAHLRALVGVGGAVLLLGFSYDQREASGPPYAVGPDEVKNLFAGTAEVELLDERDVLDESPRFRARGITWLREASLLVTVRSV